MNNLRPLIEAAWDDRALLDETTTQDAIRTIVDLLDKGDLRVAEAKHPKNQVSILSCDVRR